MVTTGAVGAPVRAVASKASPPPGQRHRRSHGHRSAERGGAGSASVRRVTASPPMAEGCAGASTMTCTRPGRKGCLWPHHVRAPRLRCAAPPRQEGRRDGRALEGPRHDSGTGGQRVVRAKVDDQPIFARTLADGWAVAGHHAPRVPGVRAGRQLDARMGRRHDHDTAHQPTRGDHRHARRHAVARTGGDQDSAAGVSRRRPSARAPTVRWPMRARRPRRWRSRGSPPQGWRWWRASHATGRRCQAAVEPLVHHHHVRVRPAVSDGTSRSAPA